MQPNPTPTQPPQTTSEDHLFSYHYFNAFDLFISSKSSTTSNPLFLLHKPLNSSQFTHFSGQYTKHDPTIYFALAREFLNYTKGLLHSQNFQHFLPENPTPFSKESLYLEDDITKPARPQKFFSKGVDDICRLLAESPFLYQDSRGIANYFIEIPLLDTERVNQAAKEMGISMEVKYFSLEEILDLDNKEISQEIRNCLENEGLLKYMEKYIIRGEAIENEEYYAVLSCNTARRDSLIPALNYCTHKKHGEKWRFYRAYDFDFPTDEELKKLKGILIPGSGNSAYWENVDWYGGLFECLRKIIYEYKHINLLCICFGAQAVAQALGGKVVKMDRSFNRGGDLLTVQESFYELEYVKGLGLEKSKGFLIGKAHGDHILELPEGAILHGSSNVANVELFTMGNNVLAMQGHPEFNEAWVAGAHYRSSKQDLEDYEGYQEKYIQEMFPNPITQEELLKVCFTFLKKKNGKLGMENVEGK